MLNKDKRNIRAVGLKYAVPGIFLMVISFVFAVNIYRDCDVSARGADATEADATELLNPTDKNVCPTEESDEPATEQEFFRYWHQPYGNVLEQTQMNQIWTEINHLPKETDFGYLPVNSWSMIGPYGMNGSGFKYTGRILDIEAAIGSGSPRVAAASGGIWQYAFFIPVGIMNSTTSQASSTLATNPNNTNIIFVGTGEETQRAGTGLWKTIDQGTTWTNVPMSPQPNTFYRIRYQPGNINRMHAATNVGYFRSDDGGNTWVRKFTGNISDIALDPVNAYYMYIAKWGDAVSGGIYKSADYGETWTKLTTNIPSSNVGRSALTLCTSSPNILFALLTRYDNSLPLGIWKCANYGASWARYSLTDTLAGGNGWYNCIIGVSPTNSNIALAGMTNLLRTTDGGGLWTVINTPAVHADQHAITWETNGTTVFAGNDGGITVSTNSGSTWSTQGQGYAITQFYNFDVGVSNTNVRFGGSQDNGISGTSTGGLTWNFTLGGDGGGVLIDRFNAALIYAVNGVYGGALAWWRQKSANYGQSWSSFNGGIPSESNWTPKIRRDDTNPDRLYTNVNNYVYRCASPYTTWTALNTTGFPLNVANVTVRGFPLTVYACLRNSSSNTAKLRVYDGSTWSERSTGLPSGYDVRTVAFGANGVNGNAYALMNGFTPAGQKIFKSTDRGVTWANITGDFPNVPASGLVQNPTTMTTLYAGSEFGFYRTTNGGSNWHRWNNGMPEANIITEVDVIDSLASRNKYYIVTCSFGRSVWMREIGGDDPTGISGNNNGIPDKFALYQNYPNPFNPATKIRFDIPPLKGDRGMIVRLLIYDILGREVLILLEKQMNPGHYEVQWDASNYPSGVYFYKIQAGDFIDTKKTILLK